VSEENKATMRRLYEEAINTGDLDRAEEFISADMYDHDPNLPEELRRGTEGFKYFSPWRVGLSPTSNSLSRT
jgi:hypothetical protein